jgi:hypothetical protein
MTYFDTCAHCELPDQTNQHSHHLIQSLLFLWENIKSTLHKLQEFNTFVLARVTTLYVTSPETIHVKNKSLYHLTTNSHFLHSPCPDNNGSTLSANSICLVITHT